MQQRKGAAAPALLLAFCCLLVLLPEGGSAAVGAGSWTIVVQNGGVSAMHMAVLHTNKVVMFDRTDFGPSQIRLPNGTCRNDPKDLALKVDCYAHSIELDISTNAVRALEILTDTWCSSGYFTPSGTLVNTGGYNDGEKVVRLFDPDCKGGVCDWQELTTPALNQKRWYSTDQVLSDGRAFIVGGTGVFSYEFLPKQGASVDFPFLRQTNVPGVQNNLYPFVHMTPDGNLFIFANNQSILLDVNANKVVRTFPDLPSGGVGGGRNYPSTGSSVMLPLRAKEKFRRMEVLVCGGAPGGALKSANAKVFVTALDTCGRLVVTDPNPQWVIETMPMPRVMGDMLILPTGDVIILNGCRNGAAGWGLATNAVLTPVLYQPGAAAGQRFQTLGASTVPRVYHSTANLVPDGRILVGGSNTHSGYVFAGEFPTELRLEMYSPWYLDASNNASRPSITGTSGVDLVLRKSFKLFFTIGNGVLPAVADLQVNMYAPPFTTHSYSMGQRQLVLSFGKLRKVGGGFAINVKAPSSNRNAPSGYYYLHIVNKGIPSPALWVRIP